MRIQHNILALNAYRNYNTNTTALGKNLEKLSSGYKINRAGDDAAGLAISEKMRAQITGLSAAQKNVKDGISLVKTAEGAMQEIHDMLNRMDYLATQSANGTYQDPVDRENLQKEVDALRNEINRIADSSNFNGIKLLDGSLGAEGSVSATYEKVDASKLQQYLQIPDAKAGGVVGTDTLLEVDGGASSIPTFEIDLDGFSFGAAANTDKITLTLNGVDVGTAGGETVSAAGEMSAADIAALFDGKTFTDSSIDGGNSLTFDIKANGSKLTFTAQSAPTGAINAHYKVEIEGVDNTGATVAYAAKDATKAEYEYNMTGGISGGINSKTIDGVAITWNGAGGGTPLDDTMNDFVTTYNAAGKDYVASYNTTTKILTLTAKTAGAPAAGATAPATNITDPANGGGTTFGGTLKAGTGTDATFEGNKGTINDGTVDVVATAPGAGEQLANTVLTLPTVEDGMKIKLGNTEYTFALGADSQFKNAENVVDLTAYEAGDANLQELAASKLTEAAKNNTIFSVGHNNQPGTVGQITLQQKSGVKDSTDMTTMDKLLGYIGISTVKNDADGNAMVTVGNPLTLQIGDTSDDFNQLSVAIGDMHVSAMGTEGGASIADIDISNQKGAQDAIQVIKDAINYVSSIRGDLGATQNRLEHTANNLSVMAENIQDAESTIRDTDVAEEMMAYTKNNILVQAAQAMLAQANAVPQGVLQLLQ